jgi:hypothetical protein
MTGPGHFARASTGWVGTDWWAAHMNACVNLGYQRLLAGPWGRQPVLGPRTARALEPRAPRALVCVDGEGQVTSDWGGVDTRPVPY